MRTVLTMRFPVSVPVLKSAAACVAAVVLSSALVSCGDEVRGSGDIVATNSVLASIVQLLVGDAARVVSIVPDGKDPHEFEPSAGDVARIAGAKVVVANGFGYEPTLQAAVARARADGAAVFDAEWSMPGLADAHWFTDPLRAAEVITQLRPVIEKATGLDLGEPFSRAVLVLQETVEQAKKDLSVVPAGKCEFAVEHILLSPFGERFSCFDSVVLNRGSRVPDAQPSAKDIEDFVASIRDRGIRAIVEDAAEPSSVLARVSEETGVALVKVNVHGTGGSTDYPGYVRGIATAIAGALS